MSLGYVDVLANNKEETTTEIYDPAEPSASGPEVNGPEATVSDTTVTEPAVNFVAPSQEALARVLQSLSQYKLVQEPPAANPYPYHYPYYPYGAPLAGPPPQALDAYGYAPRPSHVHWLRTRVCA